MWARCISDYHPAEFAFHCSSYSRHCGALDTVELRDRQTHVSSRSELNCFASIVSPGSLHLACLRRLRLYGHTHETYPTIKQACFSGYLINLTCEICPSADASRP
ncbi:hypothetical protein PsYK624_142240 [Phanerochaete sordida]|uniref:Uncharacterized protein n=1 Tax=Phanerochaete sordida TaxID=48140 RepID=A0A9P3GM76_9APHY|nr:hypothetical protein PsYK624_142240 [Phanerochaete sordida]